MLLSGVAELIPATAAPIIVADSGFRVPFYREVERLGWRWVGRVRGRDHVKLTSRWSSCKGVFAQATETPTSLGIGEWVRSNPLQAADSRVFLARLLLTLDDGKTAAVALADAMGPLDRWVANDHDALLAA